MLFYGLNIFKMQVRTGNLASASALCDQFSGPDNRSLLRAFLNRRKVRVKACHAATVVDLDPLAVNRVLAPARNRSAFAGKNVGTVGDRHVDAPMELALVPAKGIVPLAVTAGNPVVFHRQLH